ncbi:MAG: formamidopyrimidine-DNA glycosylase [Actinobacteria bacterium]|nr:formamidopyrimidine-DNA glycosylase [Actinomycetota bacterium]
MPELLEVEAYRSLAEATALRRTIARVEAPDAWYLKGGLDARSLADALTGGQFRAARRHGKLLVLDTGRRPTVGLRFGMTGRLLVDGMAGLDHLEYGSSRDEESRDRLIVTFGDGGQLRVRDPRRLGGVILEPDTSALGPDAATLTAAELAAALGDRRAPVKAVLMDQARIAGLGNLLADEILWRTGLDPARSAGGLDPGEVSRLQRAVRRTLDTLGRRGGSHTGSLQPQRRLGGMCPKDGTPLARRTIAGRTTWSCPTHQV